MACLSDNHYSSKDAGLGADHKEGNILKKNKHLKEFGPKPNMSPPDWVQARVHYI